MDIPNTVEVINLAGQLSYFSIWLVLGKREGEGKGMRFYNILLL